ncbi:MAG TPA: nucleoside-diphosphate kinase [Anaerolineaceae bacterium]|nr:nucleoside-diphosphate kinase [Anaerolineaceae bacterium]
MERSLVLIKPDGVQRGLVGEIIKRLEQRGLKLVAAKFMWVSDQLAQTHYAVHFGKPFYNGLINYICSAPVMAMVWEGQDAIAAIRQTIGATNPTVAAPGTIRHDFAIISSRNLTHASDSVENSEKEIALWFKPEELVTWSKIDEEWLFKSNN